MLRMNILSLTLLVICMISAGALPCPAPNYRGNIYTAQIIAALDGGIIPISDGQDSQCYNYNLPYAFNAVPDVAISIHSFEAEPTNNLFFFIKPVRSDSLALIPFVIRTQWAYTQWSQISFSFIADDRNDIQVGYYQIDSGPLSGCDNGKAVDVLLPFRSKFFSGKQFTYNVFLHGFEIASVKSQGNARSPFQFQIVSSAVNVSGIIITISVTTTTQVNSLYISYFAFQQTSLPIVTGGFVYDATTVNNGLYYAPQTTIPRNFARLYGLTGFLLNNNNQRISYNTKWDGFSFAFTFGTDQSLLKYFSFSYVFITGSQCQDCQGFEIYDNNACVSVCTNGTYKTPDNTCINCGPDRQYNGTQCITKCPVGQYLDATTRICTCPPTLNWNGQNCVSCFTGKVWDASSKSCECQRPLKWNGFACAKVDACVAGKVWDVFTYSCQCPETTFWDGVQCKVLPQCTGGQVLDSNYVCTCPAGYVWSKNNCIYSPCLGGQVWTGTKCTCPAGLNFNGVMCVECINGQKWDAKNMSCACDSGYRWNGQFCEKSFICSNGRIWNPTYQQCICPDGSYWSGYACLPTQKCDGGQYFDSTIQKCACLAGYNWNGKVCVQCNNGRAWNITTLSCTCPVGTVEVKDGCRFQQACTGGKQWCQNSWTCECPPGSVWNGNFCIANPCQAGQVWNESLKSCQCPDNKVLLNQVCVPPQISCTNGRVWNQFIYACACPQGTFASIVTCDPIPVCQSGRVYNPLNNQCQCPFGLTQINSFCTDPKCPVGQYWNGNNCQIINCAPPSYFEKDRCVIGGPSKCGFGYQWDGNKCNYSPSQCPSGTTWSGLTCKSTGQCGNGYYNGPAGKCSPLPQQCYPPTTWDGSSCASSGSGSICPQGTYAQGKKCYPYEACQNGFVWDANYLRCVCPPGTINSGNRCVQCSNDKKWNPSTGCSCPSGSFDTGASCDYPTQSKCSAISNSIWSNSKCLCRPGFTPVGFQCVCFGTQVNDFCDKCSYKPNSKLNEATNTCECKDGWIEFNSNVCIKKGQKQGTDSPDRCAVGTYFDKNQRSCLACPEGCLSCQDCYKCQVCRPQFVFDPFTQKCYQVCGDGKKLVLECDDGNNYDGDGCSRDCKLQQGFTCSGGSIQSKDNCYTYKPDKVKIQQVGQIRKTTSVVINLKLNYLPDAVIQSYQCANQCNQLLIGTITSGDKNAVSITSQYLSGTYYMFTMSIEFGRTYMSKFTLNVSINKSFMKYFGGKGVDSATITVEPSYLMAIDDRDYAAP